MQSPALACRGLRVAFGNRTVLDGVDLDVGRGQSVAVMGPSGSGKTTLLHCLAGLLKPDDGDVVLEGIRISDLGERRRAQVRLERIGVVFQFGELLPELTVLENIELPLRLRGSRGQRASRGALGQVGLADRADSWPDELSGGEMQRVAIARAVAGRPSLLLADEPTGALDEDLSMAVCDLLTEAATTVGAALVVATHDPAVAAAMDRTVRLRRGKLESG